MRIRRQAHGHVPNPWSEDAADRGPAWGGFPASSGAARPHAGKRSAGGKDVFVSARVLERTGRQNLDPEQRVRMAIRGGQKGPTAERIEFV